MPFVICFLLLGSYLWAQNGVDPFGDQVSPAPISAQIISSSAANAGTLSSVIPISSSSVSATPPVTDPEILKKFNNLNQEMGPAQIPTAPTESRSLGYFAIQMALALLLVIFLIWLSIWGLKKMQQSKFNLGGAEVGLNILEQIYLAPGQRIVIVRVHERVLALGVTQQNIQFLADLSSEEAYQGNEASAKQFGNSVDYFLRHFKKGATPPMPPEDLK